MRRHETEIKLQVLDPRSLKRRLRDLGFRTVRARHFERNILFDFRRFRLRKSRRMLRLRFADHQGLLTFKGAPLSGGRYKVRREIETGVGDGGRLEAILQELGLHEVFRYEKYRTVFAQGRRGSKRAGSELLLYDETPIGNYVELEGSKRWIDRIARALGYSREDYIPASYGTLYRLNCLQRGKKPGNMVFAGHRC